MNKQRKILRGVFFVIVSVIAVFLFIRLCVLINHDPDKPVKFLNMGYINPPSYDPTPRHIKIRDDDFWIPRNQLDVWSDTGFLVIVVYPDFTGYTAQIDQAMKLSKEERKRQINLNIELPSEKQTIDRAYVVSLASGYWMLLSIILIVVKIRITPATAICSRISLQHTKMSV